MLALALGACASSNRAANQDSTTTAARQHQKLSLGGSRMASPTSGGKIAASSEFTDMAMPYGETEFVVDGVLTDYGTEARVYKFAAADKSRVAILAAALGLNGPVTEPVSEASEVQQAWTVVDGTRQLTVERAAPNYWYVSDNAIDLNASVSSGGCATVGVAAPDTTVPDPTTTGSTLFVPPLVPAPCDYTPPPLVRPENMLTEQAARAAAFALLEKLGMASADAHVVVSDDVSAMSVTIDTSVDGIGVIGLTTYLSYGANGKLTFANGSLGTPVQFDSYPIITPAQAVKRLTQNFMAYGPMTDGVPKVAQVEAVAPTSSTVVGDAPVVSEPTTNAPAISVVPGTVVTAPKRTVHIKGVRIVLEVQWLGDGSSVLLVPTYEYSDTDSGTWAAVAIADEFLDTTQPATVVPTGSTTAPIPAPIESATAPASTTAVKATP